MPISLSLLQKIEQLQASQDQISDERKRILNPLANYIATQLDNHKPVNLTVICTHNSRRSHIGQLWLHAAANYFNVPDFRAFSGGTEATAFNPSAIQAMRKMGFSIQGDETLKNPIYKANIGTEIEPIDLFSKVYTDDPNPQKDFAAILVCNEADAACPIVFGADERFKITYQDPKISDGRPDQQQVYFQRAEEIGREMIYVIDKAASKSK